MAIVGVGWAGLRQAEATAELGGRVRVTWLVDDDADHLRASAARLGVDATATSLAVMLADPDVDAVSICTPHAHHAPMAIAAAAAGKHVLVEKPMATTVADATAMLEAARGAGTTLYVAENRVYEPRAQHLRRMVASGAIGELTFAACVAGYRASNPTYAGRRAWLTQPELGGTGTWMLQGIHTVAELRYVLGEVASVYLLDHRTRSFQRPDLEATMSGVVTLETGLVVWLVQTTETDLQPHASGFRLYGEAGVVVGEEGEFETHRTGEPVSRQPYPAAAMSAYAQELGAFADHVAGMAAGPTTGASERRTLAVIEAGVESARTGRPVHLADRFPELLDDYR